MLPICHVCLRTDKKLLTIDEDLENWHVELCDFAIEVLTVVQFCAECAHLLRKFYNYKEKCQRATKVLKKWLSQKKEDRKPLNLLYKQIPYSSLRLANKNNCKVYFYQELDTTRDLNETKDLLTLKKNLKQNTIPVKEFNSNFPHIITLVVTSTKNSENELNINKTQPYVNRNQPEVNKNQPNVNGNQVNKKSYINENQPSTSEDQPYTYTVYTHENKGSVKIEDNTTETLVYEELQILNDIDDDLNEIYDSNSDDSKFETELQDADIKSDRDSSDKEMVIKKKKRKTEDNTSINNSENQPKKTKTKVEKVKRSTPLNIEMLKEMLLNRFASCSEVKDTEGNLIEKDCVINNLDKMHLNTLKQIKNKLEVSQTLTPEAIQVLSRVQKKYGDQYSSVFSVEHLPTLEDAIAEFNKRQSYEGYVSAEYKCDLCYRGFKHKKMYDYHVRTYHDLQLPHPCVICKMRFKNRHAQLNHQNGHKEVFKCKLCPLVTIYRTAMINHFQQHKGMIYKCEICDSTFKSKPCLSKHMNYMHHSEHICSLCAGAFASELGLTLHKTRKHCDVIPPGNIETTENNSKTCDQCEITFVTEQVYQKHMERSHGQELPPSLTKRKFRSVASKKPNFVCKVCGKSGTYPTWLYRHYRAEHPSVPREQFYKEKRKYLCDECGTNFSSITALHQHKLRHTGAKPYTCDKCPAKFRQKSSLNVHLERHLPPTRECKHCGKKFASAANLSNHMRSHIGDRRYKCSICSKGFLHSAALREHVRGVHHHIRRSRKTGK